MGRGCCGLISRLGVSGIIGVLGLCWRGRMVVGLGGEGVVMMVGDELN